MKVWIATRDEDDRPGRVLGVRGSAEAAKALCQSDHGDKPLDWKPGALDDEWASTSIVTSYDVHPYDAADVLDADQALTAAREDIRARRRHFASLGANEEYLNALDDAYGLVNNRIGAAS